MRFRPLILALAGTANLMCQAQIISRDDSATVNDLMHLDFQVPDVPAFKALGLEPSNVLRPNEIKDLAILLSPFLSKNLALEWSPGRISSKRWTRTQYLNQGVKRLWANTAFSMATHLNDGSDQNDPFQIAVGGRVQILSKNADPQTNPEMAHKFYKGYKSLMALGRYYLRNVISRPEVKESDWPTRVTTPTSEDEKADSAGFWNWLKANDTKLPDSLEKQLNMTRAEFITARTSFKKDYWNASRIDLAVAWVGQSQDSTLKGLSYSAVHGWATASARLGKSGQLLFGATYAHGLQADSSGVTQQFTGNCRGYAGGEGLRGFIEVQYKNSTYDRDVDPIVTSVLVNIGLEAHLVGRLGIMASTGVENFLDTDPGPFSVLRGNLNLRYFFN